MSVEEYFEEETAYSDSDVESFESDDDSVISVEGLYTRREFRLRREDGHKPVYEAYRLRLSIDSEVCEQDTTTWKFLGVTVAACSNATASTPRFDLSPVEGDQSELAEMHLRALEQFQAKHRRGWVSRTLRGKPKTYEQRLDERCRRLPSLVQEQLYDLLAHRDEMSSTKHHDRKWTIVVMEEQERFRFSETDMAKVKNHKLRFWKNKTATNACMGSFLVVIRGSETKASDNLKGFAEFNRHGNPWIHVDREESRRRARESRRRRNEELRKQRGVSPFYGARRGRSPVSEAEPDRRYRSPPSYQASRDYSPGFEPENEVQARRYIRATRNAPPMVPMAPSFGPVLAPHGPPPPPGFDRSMPGSGPRMPPPPPPPPPSIPMPMPMPIYLSPGVSSPPSCFPPGTLPPSGLAPVAWDYEPVPAPNPAIHTPRPIVSVDTFQNFGYRAQGLRRDNGELPWSLSCFPPRPRSECIGCLGTPGCEHFGGDRCERALRMQTINGTSRYSHPACFICMAKASDPPEPLMGPLPPPACMQGSTSPPLQPPMPSFHMRNDYAMSMVDSVEISGSPPLGPPPYPSFSEPCRDRAFDGDATTDIESDDESELGDGETTAVGDIPRPKLSV